MKKFLLIILLFVFISFVFAQECDVGYINGTHYCDIDGVYKLLKDEGIACGNNYECFNQSCVDGLCQSKFVDVTLDLEHVGMIYEIWHMIQGIECDPRNQTYHCEGTEAFLCGVNAVWEPKGEIPGKCGVPLFTCGDGVLEEPYEECDDGNNWSNDSCKNDCTFNICGDAVIYVGVEECDDGANNQSGDGCSDECILETCTIPGNYSCIGYYYSVCNDSYMWEPINQSIGVCEVECLPVGNESCDGSNYLLCNGSYVWSDQGLVNGECGYSSGGGRGGGDSQDDIELVIFSPIEGITYGSVRIPLQVVDANEIAEYWRYSLNGAKKLDFIPNTTIFPIEGGNSLIVYARDDISSNEDSVVLVDFNVFLADPVEPGYCGDGVCDDEVCDECVLDCGECPEADDEDILCGNNICDNGESSYICPLDCVALERTDYTPVAIGVAASSVAVLGFVLYRRFFSRGAVELLDERA